MSSRSRQHNSPSTDKSFVRAGERVDNVSDKVAYSPALIPALFLTNSRIQVKNTSWRDVGATGGKKLDEVRNTLNEKYVDSNGKTPEDHFRVNSLLPLNSTFLADTAITGTLRSFCKPCWTHYRLCLVLGTLYEAEGSGSQASSSGERPVSAQRRCQDQGHRIQGGCS